MSLSHVIMFLVGMVASVPGSYFGIAWWMRRSLQKPTPRQRELFAEIRRAIDETRRELESVKGDPARSRANVLDRRLSVLRVGPTEVLVSGKGAAKLHMELAMSYNLASMSGAFHHVLEPLGRAAFDAHTLELTFEFASHEANPEEKI